jgi:SAM-dependent methyltransferase
MTMDVFTCDYNTIKAHFNEALNKDKETFQSSNDEPTPIECIEEMLGAVPPKVWERSNLKVLDPCCGNGNFHFVIYSLLLALGHEPYDILENMLYFNDINKERLNNVRQVFGGSNNDVNLQVTENDFLNTTYSSKFDIIVANPPYAKLLEDGKRASKNHNLIKDFLKKSLEVLNPGGYLVFITPDNWMSFADRNEIIKQLTALQIIRLNIHCAKKYFKKIGSSFTWYVVENNPHYKDMIVEGLLKNKTYTSCVPCVVRSYIPLYFTNTVFSILKKTVDSTIIKFKVETSSDLHKFTKKQLINDKQDNAHPYRLIHTPKQTVYASRPHKYQEGYKVFLSTTDKYNVFIDDCGMTQSIAFIRCDSLEEAETIREILKHPMYVFLNNICRWGNFNNIRILQHFPIPSNTQHIYDSFDMTDEEKNTIIQYLS